MTKQLLQYLVLLLIAAAIAYQIFLPPVVGMADNGDFARITGRFDLTNAAPALNGDRFFRYLIVKWKADPAARWVSGFLTSESLLVAAALGMNRLVSRDGLFDI